MSILVFDNDAYRKYVFGITTVSQYLKMKTKAQY